MPLRPTPFWSDNIWCASGLLFQGFRLPFPDGTYAKGDICPRLKKQHFINKVASGSRVQTFPPLSISKKAHPTDFQAWNRFRSS
eukprot:1158610-Pelagomonas_calceolata.AAC.16